MSGKRARGKRREAERQREAALDALYAEVPDMECKGLCAADVCTAIGLTKTERKRLERVSGERMAISVGAPLVCPMLRDGRCSAHNLRPLICRIWGAAEGFRCPHGCRPERLLSRQDVLDLMSKRRLIDGPLQHTLSHDDPRFELLMRDADTGARAFARAARTPLPGDGPIS